jgi:uncharacterized protein
MLVLLLAFLTAIPLPAKPTRYVTDDAAVLGKARADALNEKLAQFERETSDQVLVYVARDLPAGTTIEELGSEAIHRWAVGQKGKDNGAILFVFTGARKMRIEVGYGLEEKLTDAQSKRITSTVIKPLLRQNDTAGAIEAGAEAMLQTIRGAEYAGTGKTVAETHRRSNGFPIEAAMPIAIFVGIFGLVIFIARRRSKTASPAGAAPGSAWSAASPRWSDLDSSSSSSSDSSDSSSDSSSDFSSGGGDGGGGGASDSW